MEVLVQLQRQHINGIGMEHRSVQQVAPSLNSGKTVYTVNGVVSKDQQPT
jgi:hypothetical protein